MQRRPRGGVAAAAAHGRARADLGGRGGGRRPRPRQRRLAPRAGRAGRPRPRRRLAARRGGLRRLRRAQPPPRRLLGDAARDGGAPRARVPGDALARPRRLPRPARLARPLELRRRLHRDPAIPGAQRAQFGAIRRRNSAAQFGGAIRRNSPTARLPPPPAGGGAPPPALYMDRPAHPRRRSRRRRHRRPWYFLSPRVLPTRRRASPPATSLGSLSLGALVAAALQTLHRRARPVARRRPPAVLPLPPRLHRRARALLQRVCAHPDRALRQELHARVARRGPSSSPLGRRRPRAEGLCGVGDGAGLARRRHVRVCSSERGRDARRRRRHVVAGARRRPPHRRPTSHTRPPHLQVLVAGFLVGPRRCPSWAPSSRRAPCLRLLCRGRALPTLDSTLYAFPWRPCRAERGCCTWRRWHRHRPCDESTNSALVCARDGRAEAPGIDTRKRVEMREG